MENVLEYLRGQRQAHLEVLRDYLRIPSISSDPTHAEAMHRCAAFTAQLMTQAGLEGVLITPTGGYPVVTGSWRHLPDAPTILIYGHYDVQPVDPLSLWEKNPFDPHLRDHRLVARGAADDKGQFFMYLAALQTIGQVCGGLPLNVVVVAEGEEEIGSPHLPEFLRTHQKELAADVALVSDTSMWAEGWPALTVGLRGLIGMELQLTGPNRDLHSGTYGGGVANPLELMARLLASLKDQHGRVVIPGFYDQVRQPTPEEIQQLQQVPLDEAAYWQDLGTNNRGGGEQGFPLLERLWWRPTLEINGLWGGFNGVGSKTVVPSQAHAKISCRLVPDQNPATTAHLVASWLRANAPAGASLQITHFPGHGHPFTVSPHLPAMQAARQALTESFGRQPLLLRDGASIPITVDFKEILGIDTLLIGFSLPDARCHAPNENLHLPTFYTGIESLVRLMFLMGRS